MLKTSLKAKILSGYLTISILIVLVGFLFIFQFSSLGQRVSYLTKDLAAEVKAAGRIKTEILSMRTSVEKFIYKEKDDIGLWFLFTGNCVFSMGTAKDWKTGSCNCRGF